MARRTQLLVGLVLLLLGIVIGWCGAAISADFADLGSVAGQHSDDGSVPGIIVLLSGGAVFVIGVLVVATTPQRRR